MMGPTCEEMSHVHIPAGEIPHSCPLVRVGSLWKRVDRHGTLYLRGMIGGGSGVSVVSLWPLPGEGEKYGLWVQDPENWKSMNLLSEMRALKRGKEYFFAGRWGVGYYVITRSPFRTRSSQPSHRLWMTQYPPAGFKVGGHVSEGDNPQELEVSDTRQEISDGLED